MRLTTSSPMTRIRKEPNSHFSHYIFSFRGPDFNLASTTKHPYLTALVLEMDNSFQIVLMGSLNQHCQQHIPCNVEHKQVREQAVVTSFLYTFRHLPGRTLLNQESLAYINSADLRVDIRSQNLPNTKKDRFI